MFLDLFADYKGEKIDLQTVIEITLSWNLESAQPSPVFNHWKQSEIPDSASRHKQMNVHTGASPASVTFSFISFLKVWHHLVSWVPRVRVLADKGIGATVEPWVQQNVCGLQPLHGWLSEHAAHKRLGSGRQSLWDCEGTPADFTEQGSRLHILKGVATHQHGVEHHSQAPNVCCLSRVWMPWVQDLRSHIGWAAMFVCERVVISIQETGVL